MKKALIILLLVAVLIAAGMPSVAFQREKGRRRHQIGQLWMLIRMYYVPTHAGRYPADFTELKNLPMYSPFFDRAAQEVELVTPGVEQDTAPPGMIVLKERTVDADGGLWVHDAGGAMVYQHPNT